MLQSERVQVRIPMRSLDFFNLPNPFSQATYLWLTQPVIEMSPRSIPGSNAQATCKADSPTAICVLTV
jgi:hypothetical protein